VSYTIYQQMHYYRTDMSRIESPQYDPRNEFGEGVASDKLQLIHDVLSTMGDTANAIAKAIMEYSGPNRVPTNAELAAAANTTEANVRKIKSRIKGEVADKRLLKPNEVRAPEIERFAPKERKERSDKGYSRAGYNDASLVNLKNVTAARAKDSTYDFVNSFEYLQERCNLSRYPHSLPNNFASFNPLPRLVIVDLAYEDAWRTLNAAIGRVENDEHRKMLFLWRDGVDGPTITKRLKKRHADVFRILKQFQENLITDPLPRVHSRPTYAEREAEPVIGKAKATCGPVIKGVRSAASRAYGIHIAPKKTSTNYTKTALYGELRQAAFENLALS
jgi:hypothetical protein